MSESKPFFAKEIVTVRSDLMLTLMKGLWIDLILILTGLILTIGTQKDTSANGALKDAAQTGKFGMIRPAERWTDLDRVSYRWWEADTVVIAKPSSWTSRPAYAGDRCYVRGSTTVTIEAILDDDVLVRVMGLADPRDANQAGDCADGTAFIVSVDEATRMLSNMREHARRTGHDRRLMRLADPQR